jgi:hypothetical protein
MARLKQLMAQLNRMHLQAATVARQVGKMRDQAHDATPAARKPKPKRKAVRTHTRRTRPRR